MKSARHQAILDLIEKHPIDRQEDLLAHLREEGFDVTQATVSRDIRDLQLVKVADADGHYRYMPAAASGKVTQPVRDDLPRVSPQGRLRRASGAGQVLLRHGQRRLRSV